MFERGRAGKTQSTKISPIMAFAIAAAVPGPALGQTVPAGTETAGIFAVADGNVVDNASASTQDLSQSVSYSSTYASASATPSNQPTVTATATGPAQNTGYPSFSNASAGLSYYILVSGSDPSLSVPIFWSGFISAGAAGKGISNEGSDAGASFVLEEYNADPTTVPNSFVDYLDQQTIEEQTRYNSPNEGGEVPIGGFAYIPTDYYLIVGITAWASAQDGGYGSATADPYFYIDPNFLSGHPDYSLVFSPFVGNSAPLTFTVPEPGTWALMVMGFGMIAGALRRRDIQRLLRDADVCAGG